MCTLGRLSMVVVLRGSGVLGAGSAMQNPMLASVRNVGFT